MGCGASTDAPKAAESPPGTKGEPPSSGEVATPDQPPDIKSLARFIPFDVLESHGRRTRPH